MLRDYQPSLYKRNIEITEELARLLDGDTSDVVDAILTYLEDKGWRWAKPEGYHGAVIDDRGNYHLLHMAQSFIDATIDALRLAKQFEALGWG